MKNKYAVNLLILLGLSFVSARAEPLLTYTAADSSILVGTALSGALRSDAVTLRRTQYFSISISLEPVGQDVGTKRTLALYPVILRGGEFVLSYSSARGSGLAGFPGVFARCSETGDWTFIFNEPGTYRITFHLEHEGSLVSSNAVDIEVYAPTGKERDAWQALPTRAYAELLTYDGPSPSRVRDLEIQNADDYKIEVLKGYRALQAQGTSFTQWLRAHKDSVYGKQIVGGVRGRDATFFPNRDFWDDLGVPFPDWIDKANRLLAKISDEPLIMKGVLTEEFLQRIRENK